MSACEGSIGPAGSPGVDGVNGEDGEDGDLGAPGINGRDGEPGAPGDDGETGDPREPGVDGVDGVDGICAGRELLEITAVEGLPETLYEYQRVTLNVVSNVADPTSLSFSVPTGGQAIFTDLGDGSLSLVTGGESTDIERFTMFATDGCTIATYTFELGRIFPSPASMINVVNLTESDIDVWSALVIEDVGEVAHLEISYLGLDAGDVDSERPIKSGENVIRVFDEGDVDHPADGFEPESLLSELSVTIEPGRYYLLMLEEDEAETGRASSALFDMGPEPINAQGVLSVSHQMTDSEPVSVFTVDESVEPPMTAEVISALEYGQSSEPLAMPESSYIFGVDLDMHGEVDVNLPEFEIKDRTRNLVIVNPLETACYTGPSFTIINASPTSFSSEVSVWVPEPPPSDVIVPINSGQVDGEALLDALPYAVSYTSQENVRVGDSSYRQINAPIGTAQIRLGVSFDVEPFWDKFVVYDRDREVIYRDDGADLCVEIVVPGDIAILGVDSDGNTERSGYIIKALSFD